MVCDIKIQMNNAKIYIGNIKWQRYLLFLNNLKNVLNLCTINIICMQCNTQMIEIKCNKKGYFANYISSFYFFNWLTCEFFWENLIQTPVLNLNLQSIPLLQMMALFINKLHFQLFSWLFYLLRKKLVKFTAKIDMGLQYIF